MRQQLSHSPLPLTKDILALLALARTLILPTERLCNAQGTAASTQPFLHR